MTRMRICLVRPGDDVVSACEYASLPDTHVSQWSLLTELHLAEAQILVAGRQCDLLTGQPFPRKEIARVLHQC